MNAFAAVEQSARNAIAGIAQIVAACEGRVYAGEAPHSENLPYVSVEVVSSAMDNASFNDDTTNGELQVNIWVHKTTGRTSGIMLGNAIATHLHRRQWPCAGYDGVGFMSLGAGEVFSEDNAFQVVRRFDFVAGGIPVQ